MKKNTFIIVILLLVSNIGIAQKAYVKAEKGLNLRSGPGSEHSVVMTLPYNGEVEVIDKEKGDWWEVEYEGKKGYVHYNYLSETENKNNNTGQNSSSKQNNSSSANNLTSGDFGYTTAIGLRGGFTSGITLKHFINDKAALEVILGSRWHGLSITGLYELHIGNALNVSGLTWVYGGGARIGFYSGEYYYHSSPGNCNDPGNPKCNNYYYENRQVTAFGLVGIGGLEYKFNEIPITISLDLMPYFYFNHWAGGFIDGSMAVRYIIQ